MARVLRVKEMTEKISVAVVNNKVDNLNQKVDGMKSDIRDDIITLRQEMKEGNEALLDAINQQQRSNEDTYVKKSDFAPFRVALVAMGSIVLALVIFVLQQLFLRSTQ